MIERARRIVTRMAEKAGLVSPPPDLATYGVPEAEIARMRTSPPTDVHRAFFEPGPRRVHKWAHYLTLYDRYLAALQGRPITLLEIGVLEGGSLDMWRRYLGPAATIVGIDITPACAERVDPANRVRIGSQADPAFLKSVVAEFGAPDVILDDGSHIAGHQKASFEILFPLLKDGGLYMIEDTHTSYWNEWDGGFRRKGTAIEEAKALVDDMHAWYTGRVRASKAHEWIGGIHFHDSMIVIEKARQSRPGMMSAM